jgi:hypothetical protein
VHRFSWFDRLTARIGAIFYVAMVLSMASCNPDPPSTYLDEMVQFTTSGSTFSPVITVTGSPGILWTCDDGSTSSSPDPSFDFGSPGTRKCTLKVTPWSALVRINIGYDGGDGGDTGIEYVGDQHVTAVQGLDVVAPYLLQWCSSYNGIQSLDFSDFVLLDTIECYLSQSLENVNLANTPSLRRACFEDCGLQALDFSQSPGIQDIRGALNAFSTIEFGNSGSEAWHICVRENSALTDSGLFEDMDNFPEIAQLWIWRDLQEGVLRIPSTSSSIPVDIQAQENSYTSADFTGALRNQDSTGTVNLDYNQLTSIVITGCTQLTSLYAANNNLGEGMVDSILQTLDQLGRVGGVVNLEGNTAPSALGQQSAQNLVEKGWTVTVD